MELYPFLKLAAIRKMPTNVLARDRGEIRATLIEKEYSSVQEVLDALRQNNMAIREHAKQVLEELNPLFVLNRVTDDSKMSIADLQHMIYKFIGSELVADSRNKRPFPYHR